MNLTKSASLATSNVNIAVLLGEQIFKVNRSNNAMQHNNRMECTQIDLYEFLAESELQQYYNAIKNELKITNAAQFKYATDEDLRHIGLSRPEIRRLRKFCEKHFPHGYLSKIKRLLQAPTTIVRRDDSGASNASQNVAESATCAAGAAANGASGNQASPTKVPNNKHIIPADAISVNKQLGTGEFGIVQQGVWTNGTERIQVAIKCLCRERMQSNPMEFLKEAAIMHSIEHENIVRLYGVVLATDSLMLVTELAHLRSLLECLKDSGLRTSFLTIPTLCEFAVQICNGMKYLEQKRLIHRDLAARNILVFSKNKVKISDFGLSRALGVGKDYYKTNFNVNLKLPIAWCAPECINYLRFTNASDVWAFGVCLWEMFSYGFQPWAALTGLQILEAIDAPNYQRLEQPDCCPSEYYTLMMKCWQDDATKRPKFSEIYEQLPDMKPEQLKAVVHCLEPKKEQLIYRQGEIITVLDRNTGTPFWKGVLSTGKTGYFNPSNTVAFLEGLPSANRDSFIRVSDHRSSKRKLRTEMISKPQNDFKHTGHVGIDGASFGDIAFLGSSQSYNHVPRQIVTPYKPSEDIEQTPLLLPPTPTSPDSLQTASGYFHEGNSHATAMNPSFISSNENTPKQNRQSTFNYPEQVAAGAADYNVSTNPFTHKSDDEQFAFALQNNNYGIDANKGRSSELGGWRSASRNTNSEDPHEYHEISDDEITADKLDLGPSLLDEINSMFGSISVASTIGQQPKSPEFEHVNMKNEFAEITSKFASKNNEANGQKHGLAATMSSKKKTGGTVKQISVKDEKILNQAIEIANEISARSMIDLVSDHPPATQSPKRKFSFRFPHLSNSGDKSAGNGANAMSGAGAHATQHGGNASPYAKKKNFTEELRSIPDIQSIIGREGREAYNCLIERKGSIGMNIDSLSPAATLLRHLDTNEFDMTNAKTLPRRSLHTINGGMGIDQLPTLTSQIAAMEQHQHQHQLQQQQESTELTVPQQHAPRPMTLPTRGAAQRVQRKADLAVTLGKVALPNTSEHRPADGVDLEAGAATSPAAACESPSYMTNTLPYQFPGKAETETTAPPTGDGNVIPLPPRDGKKQVKTNAKRHVRKYPLIIPANGVQRTLSKVLDTELDARNGVQTAANGLESANGGIEVVAAMRKQPATVCGPLLSAGGVAYENMATIQKNTRRLHNLLGRAGSDAAHTYQNLDRQSGAADAAGLTDTASLHFESILEADSHKCHVLQSPDVTDGFYSFSIQKEHYNKSKEADFDANKISGLYANEDELRNLDIERNPKVAANTLLVATPSEAAETAACGAVADAEAAAGQKYAKADNELAANALFKKVRDSVNLAMTKTVAGTAAATTATTTKLDMPTSTPVTSTPIHTHTHTHTPAPTPTSSTTAPTSTSTSTSATIARAKLKANVATTPGGDSAMQTEAEYFAAKAANLANSNSVSCEDLLEFADKKPKGCERGVDSDEVRIMTKVLGKDSEPTRCLSALEYINWDVHKAIKLIKLQNILADAALTLTESYDALEQHEWDLHTTALKLRGIRPL